MSKMNLRFRTVIMILVTGIYAGCSSEPKVNELQITSDPQVELERVDQNLKNAQAAQIDVLSPKNFIAAKDSWQNAVKARSENKDQKKILHEISVSQAYLDKAVEVSKVSRQVLSGPIEARRDAQSAKVNKYFLKEMTEADKNLRAVTRRIEENDTASAVAQSEALESKYRDLELKSIKREYLDGPQLAIQQAIKEGAKKLTPQTLTLTEKKYSDDEHLIERNRHNQAIVEKASEDANLAAHRLLKIVRNAKGSKAKNPEELALQNEYNELKNTQALNDLSKSETARSEAETTLSQTETDLSNAESDLTETENKLSNSNRQLESANMNKEQLESQVYLEKEYEKVRSQFSKNEADVYKQGDKILLRLKGLSFPNNKAVITTNNFKLLAKVQKVIMDIDPSHIEVAGHTDSMGSKILNEGLSQKRADAVEAYLVSNNSIAMEKVTAKGYGFLNPITTNRTSEGRAQNRRVDIIIKVGNNLTK